MVKRIKLRTLLIGGFITLLFVILITRIFVLQIVQGDKWHENALKNWSRGYPIAALRGTITDRKGNALAIDAPAYTVVINPKVILANNMENEVVEGLHRILNKKEDELHSLITTKVTDDKTGVTDYAISREVRNEGLKVDEATKTKVKEFSDSLEAQLKKKNRNKVADSGISFLTQTKRYYPKGQLAAHILGYLDREGKPVMGLESFLQDDLKGIPGEIKYQSDGHGYKLPDPKEDLKPAVNGKNFKLTIDDTIQYYIESAMKEAYDQYKPISMTVIAADPKNMEILGLANLPTFDPNTYWNAESESSYFNYAIRAIYEPGSTFKIVTLAGTIQEKLFNPEDKYMSGQVFVKGTHTPLHDINRSGWGRITYLEGVKRSSNVAFVKMGEMLGKDKLSQYINDFGFGKKTDIELPGEITGKISLINPVQTATASYGHGVSVTPIQQLAAISAIANDGKLLQPHIIKEMYDPNTGRTENKSVPYTVRQVISPAAAKETSSYLEQVVSDQDHGTGRKAYIDGYRVAGKTGTAIKYTNGQPDKSRSVVSFIGFAPVNDPKIAMIVIMDEPDISTVGGGTVAAPVFKKIVSQSLQYMGVPKTNTKEDTKGTVQVVRAQAPDLVNKGLKEVQSQLLNAGIAYEPLGKGTKVIKQFPPKGTFMAPGQRMYLLTEADTKMEVPDLTGASLRDAMDILTLMKTTVVVEGEGFVTGQKVTNQNGIRVVNLTLQPAKEQSIADNSKTGESSDKNNKSDDTSKDSKGKKSNTKKSVTSSDKSVKDTAGKNDH